MRFFSCPARSMSALAAATFPWLRLKIGTCTAISAMPFQPLAKGTLPSVSWLYSIPPRTCRSGTGSLFIQLRPAFFQITCDSRQRQIRFSYNRGERTPFFAKRVFLHSRRHAHALRFHFRFEHFGFVGLAGIHQPPLSFRRVLRNLRHVAARLEQFLRRQNAQERHFHRALHADFLFFCLDLRELHVFSENRTAQAQFSAQDYRLLHEEALLSPADRAAANLIARVAGRWIRIEP